MEIKCVKTEAELSKVLELCYEVLGRRAAENELYCYGAWKSRRRDFGKLLVYAEEGGEVVSLVLARAENSESLVCGCVACREGFRGRGITRSLMAELEKNAKELGFKYITLGADDGAVGFYKKCWYNQIMEIHGQRIFQKLL